MSVNGEYGLINAVLNRLKNLAASWVTSGRFPVDRLPAMTDEKIWKGTGANVEEITVPPRTATKVVAANDSSADSRAAADYVCDGVADDVQIQAAIDALPVSGGKVALSSGDFSISAALDLMGKYSITIEGETQPGYPSTIRGSRLYLADGVNDYVIKKIEGSADFFGIVLRSLNINGNQANNPTGLSLVYMEKVDWLTIEDCILANGKTNAIELNNCRWVWIQMNHFGVEGLGNSGYGIYADGLRVTWIVNNSIVLNLGGIYLTSDADAVEDLYITGNQIIRNTGWGIIVIKGTGMAYLINISDNTINENDKDGVFLSGEVTHSKILGNDLIDNSYTVADGYDGIRLDGAGNIVTQSNRMAALASKQRYGVTTKDTDFIWIEHNNIRDNHVGSINQEGANTNLTINRNGGYATENSGTATMLNGAAAIVVAHGLAATPTVINVTGQHTEVSNIYVDTVGAANFTINRDGAEGNVTADRDIYWEAKVR